MIRTPETVVGMIEYQLPVTAEMVDDILSTAFESGIGYWCASVKRHGDITNHGTIDIKPIGTASLTLTLGLFLRGLQTHCQKKQWTPEEMWEQHDCEDADCIVQYALFDDIVYG